MQNNDGPPSVNKTTIAIIWIALLAVTTMVFNHVLDDINNPNKVLHISVNDSGDREIVLQQNRYGHYVATGTINQHTVEFLLDTGATLVAIPEHIAQQLKLEKGRRFQTQTANGTSTSYATTLDTVRLGDIVMHNVPASISTGMEFDEILLGMSFLKHLQLNQNGRQLRISVP